MVTSNPKEGCRVNRSTERGTLMTELIVAMAILVIAVLPLGYSFANQARLWRASYQRALVMEFVDGEMEILAAGEWQAYPEGTHEYPVRTPIGVELPAGRCSFTRSGKELRLEWAPLQRTGVGKIVRETTLP
jgi:hypothetical protein